MPRGVAGTVAGLLLVLGAQSSEAAMANGLENLSAVKIVIEDPSAAAVAEGIARDALKSELVAQLKAKIPRLKTADDSSDWLYLNVHITHWKTGAGTKSDYSGVVELSLYRNVTILATGATGPAIVWRKGAIVWGLQGSASGKVQKGLGEMVTKFAAAYSEAGNP